MYAKTHLNRPVPSSFRLHLFLHLLVMALLLLAGGIRIAGLMWDATKGYGLLHSDDAYYYVLAARNFVDLGFFTADGINSTNGFHPLWAWLLTALYTVTGTKLSLASQIFAITTLEELLRLAALCWSLFASWKYRERSFAFGFLAIALLLVYTPFNIFNMGMESTLAVFMAVIALDAFVGQRIWMLSISLSLLFLARLDSVLFVAPPLIAATVYLGRDRGWRSFSPLAVLLATFLLYSLANVVTTGHISPISGALKSSFPVPVPKLIHLREWIETATQWGWVLVVIKNPNILLFAFLTAIGLSGLIAKNAKANDRLMLLACCLACLAQLANLLLFQKWQKSIEEWYYALPLTFALFSAGTALALWFESLRLRTAYAAALLTAAGWSLWSAFQVWPPVRDKEFRGLPVFEDIKAITQPTDLLASTDSGSLSFWTERRVVNLDGLVNNFEYQRVLRDGKLSDYLKKLGVNYLAVGIWTEPKAASTRTEPIYRHRLAPHAVYSNQYDVYRFSVYSYLYRVNSDQIIFKPQDEAYRSFLGAHASAEAAYVLFRIQ